MTDWQTIETAPKNGDKLLGFNKKSKTYYVIKWAVKGMLKDNWVSREGLKSPTHWMPLPEPPVLKEKE